MPPLQAAGRDGLRPDVPAFNRGGGFVIVRSSRNTVNFLRKQVRVID